MQTSSESKSIDQAFRPAFEEIARRRTAAAEGTVGQETTHFTPTDGVCLPFRVPGQRVALVSLGTAVLAPVPKDHSRPALRIYGCFADKEEAREHAEIVQTLDPTCSLVVADCHEWLLMPLTEAARDDPDENAKRVSRTLQAYRTKQAEDGDAFQRAVREHLERPAVGQDKSTTEEDVETAEAEALVYKPPKRLRAGAEVRGQSAVAVCVVPDEFGECLVKILGCFESSAEADVWARNVASRHVTDDDVLVAPTCEWLFPNGNGESNEHYRSDELQRIMDASRRNVRAVKDYKQWKLEQEALKAASSEDTMDVEETWSES